MFPYRRLIFSLCTLNIFLRIQVGLEFAVLTLRIQVMSRANENIMRTRVLVVDDEPDIGRLIVSLMEGEGMNAVSYTDPLCALGALEDDPADIVILDVMMPKMDGYELCRRIRAMSDVPVLFLSARDDETDQVIGLTIGADDYVVKPFKPRELVARVKAHLRRSQKSKSETGKLKPHVFEASGINVDMAIHEATYLDIPLRLTPKEFAVLSLLVKKAGQPVPTSDIYEMVWDEHYDTSASNTVMVHIRHLRKKLAEIDSSKEVIQTVWGVGYRIPDDRKNASREPLRGDNADSRKLSNLDKVLDDDAS